MLQTKSHKFGNRAYNPEWEDLFLCGIGLNGPTCMICFRPTLCRKYNIERHYNAMHKKDLEHLVVEARSAFVSETKKNFQRRVVCSQAKKVRSTSKPQITARSAETIGGRYYQVEWENMFLCGCDGKQLVCMICYQTSRICRKYNVRRHFDALHKNDLDEMDAEARFEYVSGLKMEFSRRLASCSDDFPAYDPETKTKMDSLPSNPKISTKSAESIGGRYYQTEWKNSFLCGFDGKQLVCMICFQTSQICRKYNVRRHFDALHKKDLDEMDVESRFEYVSKVNKEFSKRLASNSDDIPVFEPESHESIFPRSDTPFDSCSQNPQFTGTVIHVCIFCSMQFDLSSALLVHKLTAHSPKIISKLLEELQVEETLCSSDDEYDYTFFFSTTFHRFPKVIVKTEMVIEDEQIVYPDYVKSEMIDEINENICALGNEFESPENLQLPPSKELLPPATSDTVNCPLCNDRFQSKERLSIHYLIKHPRSKNATYTMGNIPDNIKKKLYACIVCREKFETTRACVDHLQSKHKSTTSRHERFPFSCVNKFEYLI